MTRISKRIPDGVNPKKSIGFSRPDKDITHCRYEARVVESRKPGVGPLVFLDIECSDDCVTWIIGAGELMGLKSHPVDLKTREVQEHGWVVSIPTDRNAEATFEKAG